MFTDRVRGVPNGRWENPESGSGIALERGPTADADPVAAWTMHCDTVQALMDNPETPQQRFNHPHIEAVLCSLDQAADMYDTSYVLIHTWSPTLATRQDETLDPDTCAGMLAGMVPLDDGLPDGVQYGLHVEVCADADVQTRRVAFVGRDSR